MRLCLIATLISVSIFHAFAAERPNILILLGDDWSWPHAGFLGDATVETPNFDRLAEGGAVFEKAFVSAPSCTPSRLAILTGQWHWRLKGGENLGGSLRKETPAFTDLLKMAGYHIGYARKGVAPSPHRFRGADPLGDRFKSLGEFLAGRPEGAPFCFWYGAGEPHRPYRAGVGAKRGIDSDNIKVPGFLPDHPAVRSDLADYYEAIQRFDRYTGEMLAVLKERGELKNTLVIVAGDNGMPFPRAKATLYDAGTRVPLAIHWPAKVAGGRRIEDIVSLTDLAPTILDAAGLETPLAMTGKSLLPALLSKGPDRVKAGRGFALAGMERHVYAHPCRAIRTGRFLLIRNFGPASWPTGETDRPPPKIDHAAAEWPTFEGAFSFNVDPSPTQDLLLADQGSRHAKLAFGRRPEVELFDLEKDPEQLADVAGDPAYAEQLATLRAQLEKELKSSGDPRAAAVSAPPKTRPNVLFIAIDDLRNELGCYGAKQVVSPNIDRLAAEGVRFDRAYCQFAVCNPSRASLMTGLRPDSVRVWDLRAHFRDLNPGVVTLSQHFKENGYYAIGFGKIFHNPLPDGASFNEPIRWGDEGTATWSEAGRAKLKAHRAQMRREGKTEAQIRRMRAPATDDEDVPDNRRGDGKLAEMAAARMGELAAREEPFFLAVGFVRPHLPFTPPRKYWDLYKRSEIALSNDDGPPAGSPPMAMNTMYELRDYCDFAGTPRPGEGALAEADRRRLKHGYLASVSYIDALVGRLLAELDRLGLAENTIVVLWSDHGWKLGEHGSWGKMTNYEHDTRVPLVMRAPGMAGNGRACAATVELVDLYPTLCDLAGLAPPGHLEGKSLRRYLADPGSPSAAPAFSQYRRVVDGDEFMGYALRDDRYRFVEWRNRRTGEPAAAELYDHQMDPWESRNLVDDNAYSEAVERLRRALVGQFPNRPLKGEPGLRSGPPTTPVTLTIENALAEPVTVYWVDRFGGRRKMGRLAPGKRMMQKTFLSHPFAIESDSGVYRLVMPDYPASTVVIGGRATD